MDTRLTLAGVPNRLATDAWWLSDPGAGARPVATGGLNTQESQNQRNWLALLLLVGTGDVLFYDQPVGLSLALYAGLIFLVAGVKNPRSEIRRPALLLLVAALPAIEHIQALSVGFLAVGLTASLLWAHGGAGALATRGLALWASLPWRGIRDGCLKARSVVQSDGLRVQCRAVRAWAFPAGGALVLTGLLLLANPLLTQMLAKLFAIRGEGVVNLGRLSLWLGLALGLWPLLAPPSPALATALPVVPARFRPGAQSVARGLLVFNAILALQTGMDAVYLWGGASLPEGMTPAEYAHRGAYPLLVTTLLAGAFALAARPFAREDRQLRWLLLVWLAQNMALVLSALLRLELYVEALGLTYLRLHSAIWMGLVAAGLGLIAWQVWRDRSNRWLITRSLGLGISTLYVCAFVNFAAFIARENLSRETFDGTYICDLGPLAAFEIRASGREVPVLGDYGEDLGTCPVTAPQIDGWRDWGFRDWRVRRYLERMPVMETP